VSVCERERERERDGVGVRVRPVARLPHSPESHHQPSEWDQIVFFSSLDLHWKSPESDDLWYASEGTKETIWSRSKGWWQRGHVDSESATRVGGRSAYTRPDPGTNLNELGSLFVQSNLAAG